MQHLLYAIYHIIYSIAYTIHHIRATGLWLLCSPSPGSGGGFSSAAGLVPAASAAKAMASSLLGSSSVKRQ